MLDSHERDMYHETYQLPNEKNMSSVAKIFTTGRSQAVRLPLEFRFDVAEVFIRHDPATCGAVLSREPSDWQCLLDAVAVNASEDLLIERRQTSARRDSFDTTKK